MPRARGSYTALLAAAVALAGCGGSERDVSPEEAQARQGFVSVKAVVENETMGKSGGWPVSLAVGTEVDILCFDVRGLGVAVKTGLQEGRYIGNVPEDDLRTTSDPFGADEQEPPQYRLAGLLRCDELNADYE